MSETSTDTLAEIELARALFLASYEGEKGDTPDAKEARKLAWVAAKPEFIRAARRTIRLLGASNKVALVPTNVG